MTRFVFGSHGIINEGDLRENGDVGLCHIWTHGEGGPWPCVGSPTAGRPPPACGVQNLDAYVVDVGYVVEGTVSYPELTYSDWHALYESEFDFCPICLDDLIEELHESATVEATYLGQPCYECGNNVPADEYIERNGVLYCSVDCLNEVLVHA